MKIDTMRTVDYFAGIPLCFLATLLIRSINFFVKKKLQPPCKVLFIELSEMGSAILADPAMRKMQQASPTELYFLIFKSNAASLRLLNTIPEAHIFTIRADGLLNLFSSNG